MSSSLDGTFRSWDLHRPSLALTSLSLWLERPLPEKGISSTGADPQGQVVCGLSQALVWGGMLEAGLSQLLQDDLDLAVQLSHVQQEGHVVAVMLDDVVVHVDQDSGRSRRETWLKRDKPLCPRPLSNKDDSHTVGTSELGCKVGVSSGQVSAHTLACPSYHAGV